MKLGIRLGGSIAAAALVLALASCGGGGGGSASTATATPTAAVSTGAITAFGSVFVNGHEFNTTGASITDDDAGTALTTGDLEVGMVVTVNSAAGSTTATPMAADIHVSPLLRGFVEASDSVAGTITVMGQTVQVTSGTAFSDHRACVMATTGACPAIAGQGDLVVGGTQTGSFVAVHGYLLSSGGSAQIVATLVSERDYVANASWFKVEGQATAVSGTTVNIGGESLDLGAATCYSSGLAVACSGAYKAGDVVAAIGQTAPSGSTFSATRARLARLLPQATGTTVEVEGQVSSVTGKKFVVRGIVVDGTALATLPAIGDRVEVLGTVAADGSVTATTMERDIPAAAARVILAGPLTGVSAGTTAGTFNVTVLGQTAVVDSTTHIADRTVVPPVTFNVGNFATYLAAKTGTTYVVVRTMVDGSGNLHANGFDVVNAPANGLVGIAGKADAAPTSGGATNTVAVHGVPVIYDPTATYPTMNATIAAGNYLLAAGKLTTGGSIDTTQGGFLFVLPNTAKDRGFRGF